MSASVRVDGAWQGSADTIAEFTPALADPLPLRPWALNGFNLPDFGLTGTWSSADCDASFAQMAAAGAKTVALFVEWYQVGYDGYVLTPDPALSPSDADVEHIVTAAHRAGLNVFMRPTPQVAGGFGVWRGDIHPGYQDEFHPIQREFEWHQSYRHMLMHYAALSETLGVEYFSLGSELVTLTNPNLYTAGVCEQRWRGHAEAVKTVFTGRVSYDANWSAYDGLPEFTHISWWDAVDIMGIDAYYVLWDYNGQTTLDEEPTVDDLKAAWPVVTTQINATRAQFDHIPYMFSECGYPSRTTGFLSPFSDVGGVYDGTVQGTGYQAAFEYFAGRKDFEGICWWLWMPVTAIGGEGDMSLLVQGKPILDELPDLFRSAR